MRHQFLKLYFEVDTRHPYACYAEGAKVSDRCVTHEYDSPRAIADVKRIVECVNTWHGIKDPLAKLNHVKALLALIALWFEAMHPGNPFIDDINKTLEELRAKK